MRAQNTIKGAGVSQHSGREAEAESEHSVYSARAWMQNLRNISENRSRDCKCIVLCEIF